jgi:2-polyprenyl-3-methyl-5-hydroxy-6-metoxy-1,4-benzoquinol methylase
MAFADDAYELKPTPTRRTAGCSTGCRAAAPVRVLDLGCGDGSFGELLRAQGHTVTASTP